MKRKKWMLLLLFALSLSACRGQERAELSSDAASAESAASESAGGSVGSASSQTALS